jgi:hypothetical protein
MVAIRKAMREKRRGPNTFVIFALVLLLFALGPLHAGFLKEDLIDSELGMDAVMLR